jgi:hypothetical protein
MLNGIGTMRLIDKSLPWTNFMTHCSDKETEVSWNQLGQQGLHGPPGDKGPLGDKGPGAGHTLRRRSQTCYRRSIASLR